MSCGDETDYCLLDTPNCNADENDDCQIHLPTCDDNEDDVNSTVDSLCVNSAVSDDYQNDDDIDSFLVSLDCECSLPDINSVDDCLDDDISDCDENIETDTDCTPPRKIMRRLCYSGVEDKELLNAKSKLLDLIEKKRCLNEELSEDLARQRFINSKIGKLQRKLDKLLVKENEEELKLNCSKKKGKANLLKTSTKKANNCKRGKTIPRKKIASCKYKNRFSSVDKNNRKRKTNCQNDLCGGNIQDCDNNVTGLANDCSFNLPTIRTLNDCSGLYTDIGTKNCSSRKNNRFSSIGKNDCKRKKNRQSDLCGGNVGTENYRALQDCDNNDTGLPNDCSFNVPTFGTGDSNDCPDLCTDIDTQNRCSRKKKDRQKDFCKNMNFIDSCKKDICNKSNNNGFDFAMPSCSTNKYHSRK